MPNIGAMLGRVFTLCAFGSQLYAYKGGENALDQSFVAETTWISQESDKSGKDFVTSCYNGIH